MIRLDTIHMRIPGESVRGYNPDYFIENQQTDLKTGQVNIVGKGKRGELPPGLSGISYKIGGDFDLTMSAKTLKNDYLQGINLNTIGQAIDYVRDVVDIDMNRMWDCNPDVFKIDTTDNILLTCLDATKKQVCESLYQSKTNNRFSAEFHESRKTLGIVFRGTQKEKNRLICYDKKLDLLKSENKEFIKGLDNPLALYNEADKTIRIETNHTSLKTIRDRFNIADNKLQSILQSSAKVNHDFLYKIMNKKPTQLDIFQKFDSLQMQGMDYIFLRGIENIFLVDCQGDEKLARQFFKHTLKENFRYHWSRSSNPIRDIITKIRIESSKETPALILTIADKLLSELKTA